MEAFAPASACRHRRFQIATEHPTEFIDLTDELHAFVAGAGVHAGIVNVQSLHTTAAIVVNEHEPLLLADFTALLERAAPADGPTATTIARSARST